MQGILDLEEQGDEVGGLQLVPEIFRQFDKWRATQPSDRDPFYPNADGYIRVNPRLGPGDLIVFNSLVPHGVRPNLSRNKFRIAQYISMSPAEFENDHLRETRIMMWKNRESPNRPGCPGDPRQVEKNSYETAKLTPLGRKLLGLDSWKK